MTARLVGNLPAEITSFVGRRRELNEVKKLLSVTRLLTLTGPGGVGKSRLARRVAAKTSRAFPDGVWLVELAELSQGDLLPSVVATALGLHDASTDPAESLAVYLQDKHLLLIVDNCEHLVEAAAVLLNKLLAAAPHLHILTTSRLVLGSEGEHVLPVPPLSLPPPELLSGGDRPGCCEAVDLFVDRAAAALPGFAVTSENDDVISEICRRLDGIPLALELAAARLRAYPLEQIHTRLEQSLQLLTTGPRSAPTRQQTLRATIDWSFKLCSPAEQVLWARLSIFAGGFRFDAAEGVCSGDPIALRDVFNLIAGLVDKSILTRQESAHRRQARFRMLETLREYGRERLTALGEERNVQLRHLNHYRALADRGRTDYFSPREIDWFHDVGADHANLRQALLFSLAKPDPEQTALQIATRLRTYWIAPAFILEGHQWLRKALAVDSAPTEARAEALWACSYIEVVLDDLDAAFRTMAECRALAERLDMPHVQAELALCSTLADFLRGDFHSALTHAEEGVARGRAVGDPAITGEALFYATIMAFALGDARAGELGVAALTLLEEHNAQLWKAFALWIVGVMQCREGLQDRAMAQLHDAIEIFQRLRHNLGIACCLDGLACAAATVDQPERAARLMGAAHAIWQMGPARMPHLYVRHAVADWTEAQIRGSLGKGALEAAFKEGAALPLDTAIAYAVSRRSGAGGRTGRAGASPDDSAATLTRRETEIAELVARGFGNKEIAEHLVVSRRTAEAHIQHILAKLGFNSRTQIATWITRREAGRSN